MGCPMDLVEAKLNNVSVWLVRDFVSLVLGLNRMFFWREHWQLHVSTVETMLREACDMIFGLESEREEGEELRVE